MFTRHHATSHSVPVDIDPASTTLQSKKEGRRREKKREGGGRREREKEGNDTILRFPRAELRHGDVWLNRNAASITLQKQ